MAVRGPKTYCAHGEIFPAECPQGAGSLMCFPADGQCGRAGELSSCPALLLSRPRSFCSQNLLPSSVPLLTLSLPCTGGQRWTREGAFNTTSLSSAQTWVRSPVLPGSTGSWVSHAPPDITGAPRPSLSSAWSASLTGESWGPGPGHITAHFPTALGRVSQGSRSEH